MTTAAPSVPWKVRRTDPGCVIVELEAAGTKGWERWFLLRSDAHFDNAHADWAMEERHLREARDRDAGIIDVGDLFCAMQGKWDPRSDRSALREEFQVGSYLDRLVDIAAERYADFAPWWLVVAPGNHEQSIAKRHETRLDERLVARMNAAGGNVQRMPYAFDVLFRVHRKVASNKSRHSLLYHGFHGSGGGGPVTKGVIQHNRRATFLPDPVVIHTGHVHEAWTVEHSRRRTTNQGRVYYDRQVHVTTPGYKDEYAPGEGWHVERGAPPKPKGAAWLRLFFRYDKGPHLDFEIREAR